MGNKKNIPLNIVLLLVGLYVVATALPVFANLNAMIVGSVTDVPVAISYIILLAIGILAFYYLSKTGRLGLET